MYNPWPPYPPPQMYGTPYPIYPPSYQQPIGPTSPVETLSPRQIKKALKFHASIVKQLEEKSKQKEKKDEKKSTFSAGQLFMLLAIAWPFVGTFYIKALQVMFTTLLK